VAGGCVAGAALSAKGGPQSMAVGCVGFAAFSSNILWNLKKVGILNQSVFYVAAIDLFMLEH
jgi:hypothetical protein